MRFVLAWCARLGTASVTTGRRRFRRAAPAPPRTFSHTYARYYPSPAETARRLAKEHASLLRRVLAWQQVVYTESSLPVWLRDSLVNIVHLITEDGLWARAEAADPRLGKRRGRPFRNDRVSGGMPADRVHPLFVLRQPAAGLFLSRIGPLDAARLQGLPVRGRGRAVDLRRLHGEQPLSGVRHAAPRLPDHLERPLLRGDGRSLSAVPPQPPTLAGVLSVGEETRWPTRSGSTAARTAWSACPATRSARGSTGNRVVRVRTLGRHCAARRRDPPGHAGNGPADGQARRRSAVRRAVRPLDRSGAAEPRHEDVERPVLPDALGPAGGQEI